MNILLFGGTFDPPHLAHVTMVETIINRKLFDEVWYVPVYEHQKRFAKKQMSDWSHRIKMLSMVLTPQTSICEYEKTSGQLSYTHLALRTLSHQHPHDKFSWLMGSDQLPSLSLWTCDRDKQCFPKCLNQFDYYVYPRLGYPVVLPYKKLKVIEHVRPMEYSSTMIRDKVLRGESIKGLVAPEIEEYILKQGLYK